MISFSAESQFSGYLPEYQPNSQPFLSYENNSQFESNVFLSVIVIFSVEKSIFDDKWDG